MLEVGHLCLSGSPLDADVVSFLDCRIQLSISVDECLASVHNYLVRYVLHFGILFSGTHSRSKLLNMHTVCVSGHDENAVAAALAEGCSYPIETIKTPSRGYIMPPWGREWSGTFV
jgi:hypothetical protein